MTWILTGTGKHFDFSDPQPDQIDIIDIAGGLSKQCRFSGQCRDFYSVAQHSVLVSHLVPHNLAIEGLLHDASEAYCQDIPTPLKALLPDYLEIEKRVQKAIFAKFGIDYAAYGSHGVWVADMRMLATERRDLMPEDAALWPCLKGVRPTDERIEGWDYRKAFWAFINRFTFLQSGR